MRLLLIFGTRPEAIKMAPVVRALKKKSKITVSVCVTGQHREMLDPVLEYFKIIPDYDLDLLGHSNGLSSFSKNMFKALPDMLLHFAPDRVLVHGDTISAAVSALCCFYEGIPVDHVEAGLRSGDLNSPWPEEGNRKIISSLASFHFAPTDSARKNLLMEGIPESRILVTGNTVIDALLIAQENLRHTEKDVLTSLRLPFDVKKSRYILLTAHRRENLDKGMVEICNAVQSLSKEFDDVFFVFPVHLNPSIGEIVKRSLMGIPNIILTNPLDYEDFVFLLSNCYFVLSDSGGVQEEAPTLGKPVLLMREITERPEGVASGTVMLVGATESKILEGVRGLILDHNRYAEMSKNVNPYGDGQAGVRIANLYDSLQTVPKKLKNH